ncbi:MAG: aminopeptidase P family protein [Lentisphaerae bacterium]|nr:aminopeptidase P family protein [Lentisphaerota bacterium]
MNKNVETARRLADLIVASGEHSADMLYITRLNLPDAFVYLGLPEEKMAIVSDLEYDRAQVNAPGYLKVCNQNEFVAPGAKTVDLLKLLHNKYALQGFRVPYDFPVGLAAQLRNVGIECFVSSGSFFPQRNIKDDYEISCIRQAMKINATAMQKAFETIANCSVDKDNRLLLDGEVFTSERLRSVIDSTLAAHDAVGSGTIAAGGVQSSMPHHRGEGALYAHTPIVIDIFPRMNSNGYYGDLTRTVVKGQAPEIVQNAFEAVKIVRDECKAMTRAGVAGSVPYDHAMQRLTELGFPTGSNAKGFYGFFHGLGHGVGLEIHESPRLSRNVKHLLQPGEVVTVEPGVYYPEWGGIRLEDIVVVRSNGCDCLTDVPTFLEIK